MTTEGPFDFNSGGDSTDLASSPTPVPTSDPNYNPFDFNSGGDPSSSLPNALGTPTTAPRLCGHAETPNPTASDSCIYGVDFTESLDAGVIAGIVIGVVAFLALVGVGSWWFARRFAKWTEERRRRKKWGWCGTDRIMANRRLGMERKLGKCGTEACIASADAAERLERRMKEEMEGEKKREMEMEVEKGNEGGDVQDRELSPAPPAYDGVVGGRDEKV